MAIITKTKKLRPLTKIFGGKHYLHRWIISNFPQNYQELVYLEPFCGAASVFLNKLRSKQEIINDLDPALIEIWRAVQDNWPEFQHFLSLLTYSEETFQRALDGHYQTCHNEYILRRMSRSGLKKDFSWSEGLRGGQPGEINGWESALAQLPDIGERLQGVSIENMDAVKLLLRHVDNPGIITYCDSPYLHETRVAKKAYGEFEMDENSHRQLAEVLNAMKGKVLVSGYKSELYDSLYRGWKVEQKLIVNHSSQEKVKKIKNEQLWINY